MAQAAVDFSVTTSLKVLLPLPLPAFGFLLPHQSEPPPLGVRVLVPWQGGSRVGLVAAIEEIPATKALELKEAISFLDHQPFVLESCLRLIDALADYTCTPAGLVLASLLATGLSPELHHEVRALEAVTGIDLSSEHWQDARACPQLDMYRQQGLIRERVRPVEKRVRVLQGVKPIDEALAGPSRENQRLALEHLLTQEYLESGAQLSREADVPESAVRALVKKGYAAYVDLPAPPVPLPSFDARPVLASKAPPDLMHLHLSGGLRRDRLATLLPLLQGDLKAGRSVLVLVPEQAHLRATGEALVGQVPLLTLSGDMSDAQRERVWHDLQAGGPVVLLASYFGLIAPLKALGRIVVLEEGSSSYKLPSGPRLFVPDAAKRLAKALDIPYVACDLMPTPESHLLVPNEARIVLPYPRQRFHVTDLRRSSNWPLSSELMRVLKQVSSRGRQAIILAPRRGFSAALGCDTCGWLAMCPNCDLSLRYHREQAVLKCHQCAHTERPPHLCPSCNSATVGPLRGAGTEWIAREIRTLLADIPVYRYDADQRDDLSPLLAREPGIVIATTAILRHPPLANLSLIAFTLVDTVFNISDFRAEEEAFRLLVQLAELAPGQRPLTLLQTFQPEHVLFEQLVSPHLSLVVTTFLERVLNRRRAFGYPPYMKFAKIQLSAAAQRTASAEATWLAEAIKTAGAKASEILGPSPAPVARIRGHYSYQLFVRAEQETRLKTLLAPALAYRGRARLRFDVDPRDIYSFLD